MSRQIDAVLHQVSVDGLPGDNLDPPAVADLIGRVAFIWNGHVISGWPMTTGEAVAWVADGSDVIAPGRMFTQITHWLEFLERPFDLTRPPLQPDDLIYDEALIATHSILSLLHHRGLVDNDLNRQDVAAALDKLRPYAKDAEKRAMRRHESR